jgi:hypothetical protein
MKFRRILVYLLLALIVLAAPGVWAQTADDVGFARSHAATGPTSSAFQLAVPLACPPEGVITGILADSDPAMVGRIFRDGVVSLCDPPKPYPGIYDASVYHYDTYTYPNANTTDLCVTVDFNTSTCQFNAHAQAFANGFDPNWGAANAANYLGDVGSSVTQPFSFVVPALTDWVLVIGSNFTFEPLPCEYEFEVLDFPCDTDGDGVVDPIDLCPDTIIPEATVPGVRLGVNRFALVDYDFYFDTTPPQGEGPGRSYSTMDTAGCSCEQIIGELALGAGHGKFGCSISAMDDWLLYISEP